jgi:hypothetical protein
VNFMEVGLDKYELCTAFPHVADLLRSRYSDGLWVEWPRFNTWKCKFFFSLFYRVRTDSGAHQAFFPICLRGIVSN